MRYLVDPRKAKGLRQTLTLAVQGESRLRRLEFRNGVLVLTGEELASFVLGTRKPVAPDALSQLDHVLDRSHLMPTGAVACPGRNESASTARTTQGAL